jgi:hypothetical protein
MDGPTPPLATVNDETVRKLGKEHAHREKHIGGACSRCTGLMWSVAMVSPPPAQSTCFMSPSTSSSPTSYVSHLLLHAYLMTMHHHRIGLEHLLFTGHPINPNHLGHAATPHLPTTSYAWRHQPRGRLGATF